MTADHRAEFSRQIARLLHLLQAPAASSELPEVVHRIAGDAAQLGYAGLTMAARRYEASCRAGETPPPEAAAMLRDTAETALEGLGRQRGDRG